MLSEFKQYYNKASMMQGLKFEGKSFSKEDIDCDLIWNVPIYDVVNRKYAAFSSLLEAIVNEEDPKGNHVFFEKSKGIDNFNFYALSYLFRLCGSGINYIPKEESPFKTHGFGNFWVVEHLHRGDVNVESWLYSLPEKGFCDVKGYMLPMIKGGLANFITNDSLDLIIHMYDFTSKGDKIGIKQVVDEGNRYLMDKGFKRQNFVLTAFAMDLAEYFPERVDRNSDVYVGSNARKCLKLILPHMKHNDALRLLCNETGNKSKPYDMEDVACDFIRYIENFQSDHHIKLNNNIKYYNNVLK